MVSSILVLGYVGPGSALSAIGTFLALVAAGVFAVIGFVWYPIKRLVRAIRRCCRPGLCQPGDAVQPSEGAGSVEP